MKTIIATLILLLGSLIISAKTVTLSNYCTPDDNTDDAACFQTAINALKANGGGTLIVDEGTWDLQDPILLGDTNNYVSYLIKGDKGSILKIQASQTETIFYGGNTNQVEFRDLIFVGSSNTYDAQYLGYFLYAQQLKVTGCQFYGIRAKWALWRTENIDVVYENNQFGGSCGDVSAIYANEAMEGMVVRESTFFDYGNLKADYHSKVCGAAWITVDGAENSAVNGHAPRVLITQSRFDEGPPTAIAIKHVPDVTVSQCAFTMGLTTGIWMKNVAQGVVESSQFGHNDVPALTLISGSVVQVNRLRFADGATFADIDGDSTANIGYCPDC